MSGAVELLLTASPHDIGAFEVRRALPKRERRHVGPFVFFDHMGPAKLAPGTGMDVRPHPHIGLATVTYLFDGEIMHRDSLGYVQAIQPGALNWMVAGRGIAHSERTAADKRDGSLAMHGIQTWVALPPWPALMLYYAQPPPCSGRWLMRCAGSLVFSWKARFWRRSAMRDRG